MPKRPTLQDVADAAGLAPATVSYALRGERGADATVERVRAVAAELGYEVDPIARALARGRSGTIGVLCGSTRDLWQQSLATNLARALLPRGRHALIADADGSPAAEAALFERLRLQRPDGLLVAPLDPSAPHWQVLARDLPVVSIGEQLEDAAEAGSVMFDNARGIELVFDHLAALGHHRVAVVLAETGSTPGRPTERLVDANAERCEMTATLLRSPLGGPAPEDLIARFLTTLGDQRPTAVFCLSDSFALATLRAAAALGLRCPDDLSVVGFEDLEFADLAGPGLTSVTWGRAAVAEAAVGQLLAALDDNQPLRTHLVAPRLVVRGSTATPPG